MSKETREFISCLMDGEIDQESSRFLMRRLASDDEMKATWSRYHLVRECLRFQDGSMADLDLTARVSEALEGESTVRNRWAGAGRWLKPVGGAAMAASVALMAIVAVGPANNPANSAGSNNVAETAELDSFTAPQSILAPAPRSSQASLNGQSNAERQRMNAYLLRHYQAAGSQGTRVVVPAAPVILIMGNQSSDKKTRKDEEEASSEK